MAFFDPTAAPDPHDAVAYCDGACGPKNPGGTGGWGFVLRTVGGEVLAKGCGKLSARPDMTNNVAEYAAAARAVQAYKATGRSGPLLVRADSQLVVRQMSGEWGVKQGAYRPIQEALARFLQECAFTVRWEWIPRERNTEADELSKRGMAGQTP